MKWKKDNKLPNTKVKSNGGNDHLFSNQNNTNVYQAISNASPNDELSNFPKPEIKGMFDKLNEGIMNTPTQLTNK